VNKSITAPIPTEAINLQYVPAPATVVTNEAAAYLQQRMEREFISGPRAFRRGGPVTIHYGFASYNKGNRLARWMTSGLAGQAKMIVQAEFVDASGTVMGRVQSTSTQQLGVDHTTQL
jgi:hypothetical protein